MANCLTKRMRKPDRDQSISLQALSALREVLEIYPDSEYADEARRQVEVVRQNLAEHEFVVGYFNYRFRLYPAAVNRFRTVLEEYPDSESLDKTLFHLGLAHLKMQQWGDAHDAFQRLRDEHPDSPFVAKIPQVRDVPAIEDSPEGEAEVEGEKSDEKEAA